MERSGVRLSSGCQRHTATHVRPRRQRCVEIRCCFANTYERDIQLHSDICVVCARCISFDLSLSSANSLNYCYNHLHSNLEVQRSTLTLDVSTLTPLTPHHFEDPGCTQCPQCIPFDLSPSSANSLSHCYNHLHSNLEDFLEVHNLLTALHLLHLLHIILKILAF